MANPIKNFVSRLTTAFGAPVADNNNLNNPRLKAWSLLTQCRLSRNSQGF